MTDQTVLDFKTSNICVVVVCMQQNYVFFHDMPLMGLEATKPVFGVSDEVRFKPAYSATETS